MKKSSYILIALATICVSLFAFANPNIETCGPGQSPCNCGPAGGFEFHGCCVDAYSDCRSWRVRIGYWPFWSYVDRCGCLPRG